MTKLIREQIQNRREFLRGITAPDDWVDALCDMALSSLDREGVVVPREPTQEMFKAGYAAAAFPRDPEICAAMWRAMYDAATQPPREGGKEKG